MKYLAIDCFAGIGGVTSGIHQTGLFDIVSIEKSPKHPLLTAGYQLIHRDNFPEHTFINSTVEEWIDNDYPGLDDRDVSLLHGSPPCQSYRPGKRESMEDVRMGIAIAAMVAHHDPRIFTLEQVPAYLVSDAFSYIMSALTDYEVNFFNVNLTRFGHPQDRDRLFVVASKSKALELQPTSAHMGWGSTFDVGDAHALLMPTQSNQRRKRPVYDPFPTIMRSHFIEDKRNGGYSIRNNFYKYLSQGIIKNVPFSALAKACGFPDDFKFHPDKPFNLCNGAGIGNSFSPAFYRDFLKHTLENSGYSL